MAAAFNPPSPTLPGKPPVPEWNRPPVTNQTEGFATLKSIDLSLLDSDDPAVVDNLVQQVKIAIRDDGFLFLENYGVSLEQLHRQFALAQYLYNNISEEDKERLLFDPDTGRWSGYKHPYGFKVPPPNPPKYLSNRTNGTAPPRSQRRNRTVQLVQPRMERHSTHPKLPAPLHGRNPVLLQLPHGIRQPTPTNPLLTRPRTPRLPPLGKRAIARLPNRRRLLPPRPLPTSPETNRAGVQGPAHARAYRFRTHNTPLLRAD